jgi:diguanylate cyclase (GGDEF)-like protein/PAS domain S-box-containing protein
MHTTVLLDEICSKNPISVPQHTMLSDVLEIMNGMRISSVIVIEDKRPVGIFTERDALLIIPESFDPRVTSVSNLMSSIPVLAPKHLDLFEAYHLCAQKGTRYLVVVNDEGDLYGIATDTDFLRVLGLNVFSGQENIFDVMGTDKSCLAMTDTVSDAIAKMFQFSTRAIVILEADKPVGIVTERDLIRLGHSRADGSKVLADVMTVPVISVSGHRSVYFAIELMREHQIRTLAVVDEQGLFQGIITEHDVVGKIESHYVKTLSAIIKKQERDIDLIRKELDEQHVLSAVLHASLGMSVIIADLDKNVRYLNPAATELFGLFDKNIVGENLTSIFGRIDMMVDELFNSLHQAEHGVSSEFEITHLVNDEVFYFHVRTAPILDQSENLLGFVLTMLDGTEKKHAEHRLRQAATIFENTIEGIIITDANVNILSVNPAFTKITGYQEDEIRGENPRVLSSGRQDKAFYERMWASLHSSGYWQGELWNRRKDGETYAEWLTISVIRDADGQIKNYIAVFADITSSKVQHDEFEFLAHHDPLTGLPNRLLFNARLSHSLARVERTGGLVAVLMIDLDGFKQVNDLNGHQAGDRLLEVISERLKTHTRSEDTVARLGGDEFVIALEDIADIASAEEIAQKLLQTISEPVTLDKITVSVTASVGMAFSTKIGNDPKMLLGAADDALY